MTFCSINLAVDPNALTTELQRPRFVYFPSLTLSHGSGGYFLWKPLFSSFLQQSIKKREQRQLHFQKFFLARLEVTLLPWSTQR